MIDVHVLHPRDCAACAQLAPTRGCLEHTCPDCGSVVYGEKNLAGELIHVCPAWAPVFALREGDFFCLSPSEFVTGGWLVVERWEYQNGRIGVQANSPYEPTTAVLTFDRHTPIILTDGMDYRL